MSDPDALKFDQEVGDAMLKAVNDADKDIKTFVAVGSGSLDIARDILNKAGDKIKVVVLSGGTKEMTEYPMKYNNGYIVKAGAFGKSIGKLVLDVDSEKGDVTAVTSDSKLIPNDGKNDDEAAKKEVADIEKDKILPAQDVS